MDKTKLSEGIFNQKAKDYTFAVLFLLIFSVFIVFAIKPSLTTASSLKKERADLTRIDSIYNEKISDITTIQSQIEENREKLYLLDQSVSLRPEVNRMVEDLKTVADKNNLIIMKAKIADVNLFQSRKSIDTVRLTVEGKTSYNDFTGFFKDLLNQRRLKTIDKVVISRDNTEGSNEANLRVVLTIDGYYL